MTNKIEGPLGVWPFPILNAMVSVAEARQGGGLSVEQTNIERDSDGRIVSVEVIKGVGEDE